MKKLISACILIFVSFHSFADSDLSEKDQQILNDLSHHVEVWAYTKLTSENCDEEQAFMAGQAGYPYRQVADAVWEGLEAMKEINPKLTVKVMKKGLTKDLKIVCGRPPEMESDWGAYASNERTIHFGLFKIEKGHFIVMGDKLSASTEFGRDKQGKESIFHEFLHIADLGHKKKSSQYHSDPLQWTKDENGKYFVESDLVYACAIAAFENRYYISHMAYSPILSGSLEEERVLNSMIETCKNGEY